MDLLMHLIATEQAQSQWDNTNAKDDVAEDDANVTKCDFVV